MGGGVFVVRPATTTNHSSDIPSDMTEEHFNRLPLTLQVALLNPDGATGLKIDDKNMTVWIPEIERLKNLTHLEISTGMTEIPDKIAKFPKLQTLSVTCGKIKKVSPKIAELKELKNINLFSNDIKEFPLVLLELNQLERLKIGGNNIPAIPDDFNRLNI